MVDKAKVKGEARWPENNFKWEISDFKWEERGRDKTPPHVGAYKGKAIENDKATDCMEQCGWLFSRAGLDPGIS